ncbi:MULTISPECIES: helix-turn-helix domain-containing protein [Serratia]|uniref:helix-turn-helix domain-containing protein n=1 Tax=Serratia TaxID=613 RepID=UPI0007452436|nr:MULTISPECIES: XRE family transcriptional regulator [Serratia]ELH4241123.1 XRE family transcriptional regulator [Serratia marcescens]ELI8840043.1 XRE family transcriptional regulator [Serratia marcescens]EMB6254241.1 XRE family transcriptional regulator [Serratia marcescens]MBH2544676.1 XRE family transcriptional regulator [Serratia marcescens]MBH2792906.1 XRE family transcriptional regulator [Serratia marcescens]
MTKPIDSDSRHVTPAGGNVFADLGFSADEARQLQAQSNAEIAQLIALKKQLMGEISAWIEEEGYRQEEAARYLHTSRPRVSDVVNQKTEKFTLDALVNMMANIGKSVKLIVE